MRQLAAVALVGLAFSAFAQDVAVPPQEIKAKWVGKKIFARATTGQLIEFSIMPDGTASVSAGNFNDTGTWRLSENGYCTKWQKIRAGTEGCLTVVHRGGDTLVLNADGSVNTQILRVPE